jgi:hypothetical protein
MEKKRAKVIYDEELMDDRQSSWYRDMWEAGNLDSRLFSPPEKNL